MEAIGTLAGGIAHDFNNILSAIFGYSQLAQANIKDPEKAIQDIDQTKVLKLIELFNFGRKLWII